MKKKIMKYNMNINQNKYEQNLKSYPLKQYKNLSAYLKKVKLTNNFCSGQKIYIFLKTAHDKIFANQLSTVLTQHQFSDSPKRNIYPPRGLAVTVIYKLSFSFYISFFCLNAHLNQSDILTIQTFKILRRITQHISHL